MCMKVDRKFLRLHKHINDVHGSCLKKRTISKILSPLILSTLIEQNIFFPETYNAFTISEPDFMVWTNA